MLNRNRMVFAADAGGTAPDPAAAPAGAPAGGAAATPAPAPATSPAGASASPAPVAFADSLPADIREEAAFRDIKDLGSLAKSYLHAQKLIGKDPNSVLVMPGLDDEAALAAVYDKLGRPAEVKDYKLTAPTLPEGVAVDEKLQSGFLETAHKIGLNTRQADALYQWWNSQVGGMHATTVESQKQAMATSVASLRTEFGAAFQQNLDLANQAVVHFGGEKLKAELEAPGADGIPLGNNPELVKVFAKIGKTLAEDGVIGRGGANGASIASPTEARQQINALRGDQQFMKAYMDAKAPGHADAVKKMADLHEQAYPTAA